MFKPFGFVVSVLASHFRFRMYSRLVKIWKFMEVAYFSPLPTPIFQIFSMSLKKQNKTMFRELFAKLNLSFYSKSGWCEHPLRLTISSWWWSYFKIIQVIRVLYQLQDHMQTIITRSEFTPNWICYFINENFILAKYLHLCMIIFEAGPCMARGGEDMHKD